MSKEKQTEMEMLEKLKTISKELNQDNVDCSTGVCVIRTDNEVVERLNKKIITEDGRQLLI